MLIRGISISGLVLVICFLLARPNESDGRLNLQSTDLPGTGRVSVLSEKLSKPKLSCSEEFITHNLDHYTSVEGDTVDQFEANGAGVALGDLDGDSDLDVVLGNDSGTNTILWNQAAQNLDEGLFPNFLSEHMPFGNTRAVNLVDVDADGRLDIVMTRRNGAFNYLRNTPQTISEQSLSGIKRVTETGFVHQVLPGIAWPAYAMNWADLDLDGDLDLVTGSYDASLLENQGNDFLIGNGAGVFIYTNQEGKFVPNRLAEKAQAMAITFFDINRDKLKDIIVGNDFAVPDYAWLSTPSTYSSVYIKNRDNLLSRSHYENLALAGAFNSVNSNRKQTFMSAQVLVDLSIASSGDKHNQQENIFGKNSLSGFNFAYKQVQTISKNKKNIINLVIIII